MLRIPVQDSSQWFPAATVNSWAVSNAGGWRTIAVLQGKILTWLATRDNAALIVACTLDMPLECRLRTVAVQSGEGASVGIVTALFNESSADPFSLVYAHWHADGSASIQVSEFDPILELLTSSEIKRLIGTKKSAKLEDLQVGSIWQWSQGKMVILIRSPEGQGVLVLCQAIIDGSARLTALDKVFLAACQDISISPQGLCGADGTQVDGTLGWLPSVNQADWCTEELALVKPFRHSIPTDDTTLSFLLPVLSAEGYLASLEMMSLEQPAAALPPSLIMPAPTDESVAASVPIEAAGVSTVTYLAESLKLAFAHDSDLLSHFPGFLDLSDEVSAPHEYSREAAAQLWPIYTEAIAAADDWRYADGDATKVLGKLLMLVQPVTLGRTNEAITYLSSTLALPAWCLRAFLVMRDMLPVIYLQVLSWYSLYLRVPKDVLFHPSVPPLSTLLHPDVELQALQSTIAVVLSNIQEPLLAEQVLRGVLDMLDPEVRKAMLVGWWELLHPMELDSVALLYSTMLSLNVRCQDEGRLVNASASLMQRLVVDQMLLPQISSPDMDWVTYCMSEVPFSMAHTLSDVISSLLRIASMCTEERICDVFDMVDAAVPPAVLYASDMLRLAHSCCTLTRLSGLDTEAQAVEVAHYLRELLFSSYTRGVYFGTCRDQDLIAHVMKATPKKAVAVSSSGWDSDNQEYATEPLISVLCRVVGELPSQSLPYYIQRVVNAAIKTYVEAENARDGLDSVHSDSDDSSAAPTPLAERAFSIILSASATNLPLQSLIADCLRHQKPLAPLLTKILSKARKVIGEARMSATWLLTMRIHSATLLSSPAHHSAVLDSVVTPFDLSHYALADGNKAPLVAASLLCESLKYADSQGLEGRLARLCSAIEAVPNPALKFMIVAVCTVAQRSAEGLETSYYVDLLLWRAQKYFAHNREEIHRLMSESIVPTIAVVEAVLEATTFSGDGPQWLQNTLLPGLAISEETEVVDLQRALLEAEEVQEGARVAVTDAEAYERQLLWLAYSTELLGAWVLDAHTSASEWLLVERSMLMSELWERRNLVWMAEYFRAQEGTWMRTVGQLWQEISRERRAIEDEEDLDGRDGIAAQFAREDVRIQSRAAQGDVSSTDDEDWLDLGDTTDPSERAQRVFADNRASIRSVLKDLGIK